MIHTPGIFVDRIFVGEKFEGRMEKVIYDQSGEQKSEVKISKKQWVRNKIAGRAAKEVSGGMNLNLGIGIPTLLP